MQPTKTVKIKGKEYPFHFGTGAVKLFGQKTDKGNVKMVDLAEVLQEAKLDELDILIWCGLKSGGAKAEDYFEKSIEEVEQMLEDDPYALDQAMDIIEGLEEEYSEDAEGKTEAKGES